MSLEKTLRAAADDPKRGMTLDELARFVQQAMRDGIDGTATVKVVVTWRSGIKRIEVAG